MPRTAILGEGMCDGLASHKNRHVTKRARDNAFTHLKSSITPGDQSDAHIDIKQLFFINTLNSVVNALVKL